MQALLKLTGPMQNPAVHAPGVGEVLVHDLPHRSPLRLQQRVMEEEDDIQHRCLCGQRRAAVLVATPHCGSTGPIGGETP